VLISNPTFTVVKVLSPNGGEIIPAGPTYTVRWGAPSKAVKFRLYYSTNNGLSWKTITTSYVTGTTYSWTVPTFTSSQKNCLIKVNGYDSSGSLVSYDRSDKVFKIEVVMLRTHRGEDLP
jgi:hypothetical protein